MSMNSFMLKGKNCPCVFLKESASIIIFFVQNACFSLKGSPTTKLCVKHMSTFDPNKMW